MSDFIEYKSNNGYTGRMYGKTSLSIFETASGIEVFHTGFRRCNNLKELRKQVEEFPELLNALYRLRSSQTSTRQESEDKE